MTCEHAVDRVIEDSSATAAWKQIANAIHEIRYGMFARLDSDGVCDCSNAPLIQRRRRVDGNERFGLLEDAVVAYVQEQPSARMCADYRWRAVRVQNYQITR